MAVEYDRLEWHLEGEFPKGAPPEQGFVHIGIYLTWLILHDLVDPAWVESNGLADEVAAIRARRMTACALREAVGGTLSSEQLTPQGRRFTGAYYSPPYGYNEDWQRAFGRAADRYAVPDGWRTYDRVAAAIDRTYAGWLESGQPEELPVPSVIPRWLERLLFRRSSEGR